MEATPTALQIGSKQVNPGLSDRAAAGQRVGLVEVGTGLVDGPALQPGTGPTQQVGQPSLIVGVVQHLERPPEKPIGEQPVGGGFGPGGSVLGPRQRGVVKLRTDLIGFEESPLQLSLIHI